LVIVLADQPVTDHETRLDIVDNGAAGLAEQVGGHPMCGARAFIGADVVEGQGKVLGPAGEHSPHVACILATQGAKDRVAEGDIVAVAGDHGLGIQALEGLVEAGDQVAVGVAHGGWSVLGMKAAR